MSSHPDSAHSPPYAISHADDSSIPTPLPRVFYSSHSSPTSVCEECSSNSEGRVCGRCDEIVRKRLSDLREGVLRLHQGEEEVIVEKSDKMERPAVSTPMLGGGRTLQYGFGWKVYRGILTISRLFLVPLHIVLFYFLVRIATTEKHSDTDMDLGDADILVFSLDTMSSICRILVICLLATIGFQFLYSFIFPMLSLLVLWFGFYHYGRWPSIMIHPIRGVLGWGEQTNPQIAMMVSLVVSFGLSLAKVVLGEVQRVKVCSEYECPSDQRQCYLYQDVESERSIKSEPSTREERDAVLLPMDEGEIRDRKRKRFVRRFLIVVLLVILLVIAALRYHWIDGEAILSLVKDRLGWTLNLPTFDEAPDATSS